VAHDSATNDSRAETAAERLKAIRARVAELHRRIQTERDPKAVAELRRNESATVDWLTKVAARLGPARLWTPWRRRQASSRVDGNGQRREFDEGMIL